MFEYIPGTSSDHPLNPMVFKALHKSIPYFGFGFLGGWASTYASILNVQTYFDSIILFLFIHFIVYVSQHITGTSFKIMNKAID